MTTPFDEINHTIDAHLPELRKDGALSVRPGFEFTNNWITGRPAVVVTVADKQPASALAPTALLPDRVGKFPVDVHQATALQRQRLQDPQQFQAAAAQLTPEQRPAAPALERTLDGQPVTTPVHGLLPHTAQPNIAYSPAPHAPLTPITAPITIHCQASPDDSWPHLRDFLTATQHTLTVGLYDFTSAHILTTLTAALAGKKLQLVLDHPPPNPTAEQSDEQTATTLAQTLATGFTLAWALDNHNTLSDAWIYPSAYHIKVAVRDHATVWLSSGNWNNSNQPAIAPATDPADADAARGRDRDWHVIIDHPALARTFEAYLHHDLTIAAPHSAPTPQPPAAIAPAGPPTNLTPPFAEFFTAQTFTDTMTLTPLLTPDPGIYVKAVTELVTSARHTLYLQYQYIQPNPAAAAPFQDLIAAVVARQHAGVDVKIILSEFETREHLEALQNLGLDVVTRVKIQANVHNKGIVADSQRVLVSSQNWSTAGVLENRDAGLIIDHADVAHYYEQIFLHDWNTLADHHITN